MAKPYRRLKRRATGKPIIKLGSLLGVITIMIMPMVSNMASCTTGMLWVILVDWHLRDGIYRVIRSGLFLQTIWAGREKRAVKWNPRRVVRSLPQVLIYLIIGGGCSPNENFKFCIRVYWLDEFWLGIAVPGNHFGRRVEDLIQLWGKKNVRRILFLTIIIIFQNSK